MRWRELLLCLASLLLGELLALGLNGKGKGPCTDDATTALVILIIKQQQQQPRTRLTYLILCLITYVKHGLWIVESILTRCLFLHTYIHGWICPFLVIAASSSDSLFRRHECMCFEAIINLRPSISKQANVMYCASR